MLIRIIPETDAEKARFQEEEHSGVMEFFIMGNKRDEDKDMVDFHRWTGAYRYLIGSLHYFLNTITEEQKTKVAEGKGEMGKPVQKKGMMKNIKVDKPNLRIIDTDPITPVETPAEVIPPDENRFDMKIDADEIQRTGKLKRDIDK